MLIGENMKNIYKILIGLSIVLLISITVYAISLPYYPNTLPNGNLTSSVTDPGTGFVLIDDLKIYLTTENINVNNIYFKVVVPDDLGNGQWNLSQNFMERKPSAIIYPYPFNTPTIINYWLAPQPALVYVCCTITFGDLLYTANASNPDGTFNISLAGTLTNNYDKNWKSRVYNGSESSWGNVNVGKATNPDIYNRRAILSSDGVIVGYAMQSINTSYPVLIKIYKI